MGYRWLRKQGSLPSSCATFLFGLFALVAGFAFSHPAVGDTPSQQGIRIQQEALTWTTDYEGLIDGKIGDETIKAIKKFQASLGAAQTGTLTSSELEALVKQGYAKRNAAGFKQYTDTKAGVSVGIPANLLPPPKEVAWGKSWYNKKTGLAIDTLRFKNDVSLRALYDKFLTINNRTVKYKRYTDNGWFVIAAFEKDAAIYIRAEVVRVDGQPDEIRGFSIWMSKERPESYQSIPPAMLSSFRSNTDTSRDVSPNVVMGGPTGPIPSSGINSLKLIPNNPPVKIEPISVSGPASSATPCIDYKGLGDCPAVLTAK